MDQEVLMICIAYEQGFVHGFAERVLPNPHQENTKYYQAWDYGWHQGMAHRQDPELRNKRFGFMESGS